MLLLRLSPSRPADFDRISSRKESRITRWVAQQGRLSEK